VIIVGVGAGVGVADMVGLGIGFNVGVGTGVFPSQPIEARLSISKNADVRMMNGVFICNSLLRYVDYTLD
jgi:hypothetical protein